MNEVVEKVSNIISPVYIVGGCVRDTVLGREPNDYDFTTPKLPDEVEAAFSKTGRKVWVSGKRWGTIASKVQLDDGTFVKIEITTFRKDKYTEGNRNPEVEFTTHIEEDLSRRDFTMNAMAMRGRKIIDPYKGQEDIAAGIIRSVGNPRVRFKDDPVRIIRAARFASKLGFIIEDDTYAKMIERAHSVLSVKKERITPELDIILLGPNPSVGLDILMQTGVISYIIPELSLQNGYDQNSSYHSFDLWTHTLKTVEGVEADINLRWAALLHDIAKPFVRSENQKTGYSNYVKHDILGCDMVQKTAIHLKWSKERRDVVRDIVLNHGLDSSPIKKADDAAKRER